MTKTLVIIEALFLGGCLRILGLCSFVKHWVHFVMLGRIELEEPKAGLWTLGERDEVVRVAEDFNAGLRAKNDDVACLLSLANTEQGAL